MSDLLAAVDEKFGPQFEKLNEQAADLAEKLEHARDNSDQETAKALTEQVGKLDEQVKVITAERDAALREAEMKSMATQVEALTEALRNPSKSEFSFGVPTEDEQKAIWGGKDNPSFFDDARKALIQSDPDALDRWKQALDAEGKAMTEGTGSAGGLLVPDQVSNELLEFRQAIGVLRPLFSNLQVSSDTLRIPSITSGLTAGWVAELAEKPAADLTFGELSVNTFTKAGLAVASNQLIRDSRVSLDRLVYREIAKKLAWLEEIAFLNGSGTGQPRGILNTTGVDTVALTATGVLDLLDAIVDAITAIYTDFFEGPDAIVMHPRTWARIVKARESATSATYLVGPPSGGNDARRPTDRLPGYGSAAAPRGELFGYPVYTTTAVPTNLGAGTNQSAVVVGKFEEGLILDHDGISLSASEHVYFTSNQTVFRAEDQVGFTAARYPKAFKVVGGAGLANG